MLGQVMPVYEMFGQVWLIQDWLGQDR